MATLVYLLPITGATDCVYDSGRGATFDLYPLLQQYGGSYHVHDNIHTKDRNFTYVFNVCGNTQTIPGSGPRGLGDGCVNTSGVGYFENEHMWGPAPAYQVA